MPHIVYWMHLPSIWITRQQSSRICTSNSLCLHTDGWFFSLCSPLLVLLLLNLSRCVYRRWITLHFHSEMHWIKKKKKKPHRFVVRFYGRLCHFLEHLCLEVMYRSVWDLLIAWGCRLVPEVFAVLVGRRWGSGPRGVFFFFFFFFSMLNWPLRAQGGSR